MKLMCFENFTFRKAACLALLLFGALVFFHFFPVTAFADGVKLPGDDASGSMVGAGTLMRFIDTGLFRWAARVLAGICIFAAAWNLKEMRFGPAFISLIAAILFGTAPTWVRNIFSLGGADTVFSSNETTPAKKVIQDA